ncbi:short-chain dehydrogenase/reductase SDR [Emticicia oligotrophica DSM 17448]|uniref:Short-chain dehydrogenase/reductase SDR n=1 Tax=Emticicia oligotrophica (strain DSM 17448 / CIP 109782 / MTCC 6937 / GPTSA100-15) TaxID=929562 RepID=A0ABM5N6C5_EMTOG|nr:MULTISPECIES: SDR family NAD(P)-dependent oxidoreductase [Emticicia]AFK05030.1 short-chain dehydrogenase/reductase SDR [Emticicia oligotrophica DSM 17448]
MKIILIGATSGIGRSLAELYASQGHELVVTGRRVTLLEELKNQFPDKLIHPLEMDVAKIDDARKLMDSCEKLLGEIDLIIINAGVGYPKATYEQEINTIDINVRGFVALAQWSYNYFAKKGRGQLVGVSSLASQTGSAYSPEYHASKAFMANYMSGLRMRSAKYNPNVYVTDIRPGYVDTPMTKQNKGMFWVATPEKAARQIANAIVSKRKVVYITKRYIIIATLLKILPEWLLSKLF